MSRPVKRRGLTLYAMASKPRFVGKPSTDSQPTNTTYGPVVTLSRIPKFKDFLVWEVKTKDAVDFKKIYVDMTGNLHAGLLLSQIVYWNLPKKGNSDGTKLTIRRRGRVWLAKTDAAWWAEVRLSPRQARAARLIIEECGLITCRTMRFNGNPTTHISINEEAFAAVWTQTMAISAEARDTGWVEGSKTKGVSAKQPGSKPASGNRRSKIKLSKPSTTSPQDDNRGHAQGALAPKNGGHRKTCYYCKGKNKITKKAMTELSKSQNLNCLKDNNLISEKAISLTESTAQTNSEIFSKSGGELDTPDNGRADDPAENCSSSIIAATSYTSTTTTNAALKTATPSVIRRGDNHNLTGAPGGAHSNGSNFMAASLTVSTERQDGKPTSRIEVPPGPAIVVTHFDQDHGPQHIRTILEPKLGGAAKLNTLLGELPPGVIKAKTTRTLWLSIPAQRIYEILELAEKESQNPWTSIISLLDQEIGATILRSAGKSGAQAMNGGATTVLTPGASKASVDSEGALNGLLGFWMSKKAPVVMINVVETRKVKNAEIVLEDGRTLSSADLVIRYGKLPHQANELESDSVNESDDERPRPRLELN